MSSSKTWRFLFTEFILKMMFGIILCRLIYVMFLLFLQVYTLLQEKDFILISCIFWFSGAIIAVIIPGFSVYHSSLYIYSFIASHMFEIFAVFMRSYI
ncbi:Uncharacterised protein [Streptobacillus moniliformis]|nr:Uncharacterised protein [Streptobacillus moniliformis]